MFQGRYGHDRLNRTLFIAALALSVLSLLFSLLGVPVVSTAASVLSWVLLLAGVLRMFSRNFYARQQELTRYMRIENDVVLWWRRNFKSTDGGFRSRANNVRSFSRERRRFKYLVCPHCAQKLRVPRGKGKLRVTCTKCGYKFEAKS
ncbi:MAG: zinc ribbon domain-containing protein [Clostridiaceae bacterium]|nr:hypothetical protein [Eubacteriales bacterium]